MEEFYQEQLCFMHEELRNRDNVIALNQLSKQTEYIADFHVIDNNNNNNDNLSHKK